MVEYSMSTMWNYNNVKTVQILNHHIEFDPSKHTKLISLVVELISALYLCIGYNSRSLSLSISLSLALAFALTLSLCRCRIGSIAHAHAYWIQCKLSLLLHSYFCLIRWSWQTTTIKSNPHECVRPTYCGFCDWCAFPLFQM